ncbi:YhgE/Pip domain-containing protein [Mobilicoccus pelagius]|uniref:Putative ABC transporter permease protein n=1 Tax=Mobilicoccus pelagius NBRC 104925 TaxID=1089455 RepID=H5UQ19_9MICO|nr:YhgE/Pip domain-containing protein [Mobilicoccus pelagius]GAB47824.1 putative ABC transporter permease protein [Mobilicoccus pelagius NBRC 104925]
MSFLPSLSSAEFRRFSGSWFSRIVLVAIITVPSLYGGLLVWANRDVTTHLNGMSAAVVNNDEMVEITGDDGKKQPVMVGRLVASKLTTSTDKQNLDWELTDADTASKGLEDGTYYAVLTIPEGFSSAAVSTQDADGVRAATMDLKTNDAVSYLSGNIASTIGRVVAGEVGNQLSEQYLDKVYVGLNTVKKSLTDAGNGAGRLAKGSKDLSSGAGQLDQGTERLTVGLSDLANGADKLAAGTGDLSGGIGRLSSGAGDLADGAGTLASGNTQLAQGLGQLESSTAALPQQVGQLSAGAKKVADGNRQLADGATKLSDGLKRAQAPVSQLPTQTKALADGATKLADGATALGKAGQQLTPAAGQLTTGAAGLRAGADKLADGADRLSAGTKTLATGAQDLSAGATKASEGVGRYTGAVSQLAASCEKSGAAPQYCEQLAAVAATGPQLTEGSDAVATGAQRLAVGAAPLAKGAGDLAIGGQALADGAVKFADGATKYADGATRLADGATRLGTGATPLRDGLTKLADGIPALAKGIGDASTGADRLATATGQLATGSEKLSAGLDKFAAATPQLVGGIQRASTAADQLAQGATKLSAGATQLSTGARSAAQGAQKLDDGASKLAKGTADAQDGASKLNDGTGKLVDGSKELAKGSDELATGLQDGAKKAPSYSKNDREKLGEVVADPVRADVSRINAVPGYGHGLAPYFMAIGLWVGAMGMFFVIRPLPKRAIASTAASWRVALAGYATPALLGICQAILQVLVVRYWVDLDVAHLPALFALAVLTSLAFIAINQALVAALGTKGRFVALVLVVLQLSAAGATYPIESSPEFFQKLHPWLPLTYGVNAFRSLIAGGGLHVGPAVASLTAWIVLSGAVTIYAARSQRTWTPQRLRPHLAL